MYSLFDEEDPRFIATVMNLGSKEKCIEKGFDYATETNSTGEKLDWVRAGNGKEGALGLMGYVIKEHEEPIKNKATMF